VSQPPLSNPLRRVRAWVAENPARAQVAAITGVALGLIVVMMAITIVVIVRMAR
jgi:hypothetical protein